MIREFHAVRPVTENTCCLNVVKVGGTVYERVWLVIRDVTVYQPESGYAYRTFLLCKCLSLCHERVH